MKIDRDKKGLSNYSSLKKAEIQGVRRGTSTSFGQELSQKQEEKSQYIMQELLGKIDKIALRLNRTLNINDLMTYRMLVKNFLKEASEQAYFLDRKRGRSRRGRSILITIRTIDMEVEELVESFLQNETEPTHILEQIDKIRGMLVDLMV